MRPGKGALDLRSFLTPRSSFLIGDPGGGHRAGGGGQRSAAEGSRASSAINPAQAPTVGITGPPGGPGHPRRPASIFCPQGYRIARVRLPAEPTLLLLDPRQDDVDGPRPPDNPGWRKPAVGRSMPASRRRPHPGQLPDQLQSAPAALSLIPHAEVATRCVR